MARVGRMTPTPIAVRLAWYSPKEWRSAQGLMAKAPSTLRRKQFKKTKLRWRVSNPKSSKYSLGWIPFKAAALRYRNGQVHFSGLGPLSLWDSYGLSNFELGPGSFSEDARGRWYLNVTVKVPLAPTVSSNRVAGIDLGLKTAATTSDGAQLEAKHYHRL